MFFETLNQSSLDRSRGLHKSPYYGNGGDGMRSTRPKSSNLKRLIVVDPSLESASGHHQQLLRKIQHGSEAYGLEFAALTHKDYNAPKDLSGRAYGVFSADIYGSYKQPRENWTIDDQQGWSIFIEPLIAFIKEHPEIVENSVFLFHTAEAYLFAALGTMREQLPENFPYTLLVTPYTLEAMPNRHFVSSIIDPMRELSCSNNFSVLCEIRELSRDYIAKGVVCDFLELPFWADLPTDVISDPQKVVIASLGTARDEKGFPKLPEIIDLVLNNAPAGSVKFSIQVTPQRIGYTPTVEAAVNKLRAMQGAGLELIETTLSDQEYVQRLVAADGLLCPYDISFYRSRGSGLAVDALNFNCVPFGTKGTLPGEFSRLAGFDDLETPVDFAEAILDFIEDRSQIGDLTRKVFAPLRHSAGSIAYVDKICRIYDFQTSTRSHLDRVLNRRSSTNFVSV